MLLTLAREVEGSGAKFFLTAVPPRPQSDAKDGTDFAAKCRAWTEAHGVAFIDLSGPFRREAAGGRLLVLPSDVHWTADGNRVAAEAIRDALADVFVRRERSEARRTAGLRKSRLSTIRGCRAKISAR